MLALQLALLFSHAPDVSSTAARISDLMLSSTPGNADTGTSATVTLEWQSYNLSDVTHAVNVFQDGQLVATVLPSLGSWTKTVTRYAEATEYEGDDERTTFNWQFRVELRALSGNALVSVLTAAWNMVYRRVGFAT